MITELYNQLFKTGFSCAILPAGIEILPTPETITLAIPPDRLPTVTEGQLVISGESLCTPPEPGSFSPINGLVQSILSRNCGAPKNHMLVTIIKGSGSDITARNKRKLLFEPSNDLPALSSDELRERCAACGFHLPINNQSLLVMMVDEDIDRITNRWYFENEFDSVLTGLRLIKRIMPETEINIILHKNSPAQKIRHCSEWGRVITLPLHYPDVLVNCIIQRDQHLKKMRGITVIGARQCATMVTSLMTGYAGISFLLSFKNGLNGASKLYEIPIGMTIGQFFSQINYTPLSGMQIIIGGEMTGMAVHSLSQPLTPSADSLLVIPPKAVRTPCNTTCINCGKCSHACPAGLRIDLIGKCIERKLIQEAVRLGISDCIECGICTAVCRVRRPLAHLVSFGKSLASRSTNSGVVTEKVKQ